MNITKEEFEYIKQQMTAQMIQILIEEKGVSLENAFDKVYSSEIYEKLSDINTGLFMQSPRYILSYLHI
ncbi:MAG: hypothetical protein IKX24_01835 [Prevotella sp.]|nr:hypothetical protein [Prevotella sp.]MBR5060864.1 hypothetical protein [Prevotella sp.]